MFLKSYLNKFQDSVSAENNYHHSFNCSQYQENYVLGECEVHLKIQSCCQNNFLNSGGKGHK